MERTRTLAVSLVAAAALVAPSIADAAPAPKVTGGVNYITSIGNDAKVSLTAQGEGDDVQGNVNVRDHDGVDFKGDVLCLEVDGNTATLSGVITSSSGSNLPGNTQGTEAFFIVLEDNGQGKNAAPDRITVNRGITADEAGDHCEGLTVATNVPVHDGNLQVR